MIPLRKLLHLDNILFRAQLYGLRVSRIVWRKGNLPKEFKICRRVESSQGSRGLEHSVAVGKLSGNEGSVCKQCVPTVSIVNIS